MPDKYHIKTQPVPPRLARVGRCGVVDWREDCARCHNCVKKACVYDRYRNEAEYLRTLQDVNALYFDCMGCFSCVQSCTKNLLRLAVNPVYEALGNAYWTPEIIRTTWVQAETAKIPVSGAGYPGPFSGPGFDAMWTDMSEIVRPTRDGIHGREYISTSVDIGRKPSHLSFKGDDLATADRPLVSLPMPLILDLASDQHTLPKLEPSLIETAVRTGLIVLIDSALWPVAGVDPQRCLPHVAFYLRPDGPQIAPEVLKKTRLVEVPDSPNVDAVLTSLKKACPALVTAVRVELTAAGPQRAIELSGHEAVEVIHVVADLNGNEVGLEKPRHIKDLIRQIHTGLIEAGKRDEVTVMAGGGIALPEHMAKAIICGADLVTINLPLLIALECHLCKTCRPGTSCPAQLERIDPAYAVGRMTNLIAAWHDQLIEVMGAMGMREARRLRGDVGRAMFFEQLEEETFGKLFGTRRVS
jgi:ferredoxin